MRLRRLALRILALGAVALGTTYQLGSCTLDENGTLSVFLDTLGIQDLQDQFIQNSPFSDFFERMHDRFEGGE